MKKCKNVNAMSNTTKEALISTFGNNVPAITVIEIASIIISEIICNVSLHLAATVYTNIAIHLYYCK